MNGNKSIIIVLQKLFKKTVNIFILILKLWLNLIFNCLKSLFPYFSNGIEN